MKRSELFWTGENLQAAEICESKNSRLYYGDEMFTIYKKLSDGSIFQHSTTKLFQSRKIKEVLIFLNTQ